MTELAANASVALRALVELARTRQARDDAVCAAVADGMSYREVAATIGLSHSRVAQIVTTRPRP